MKIAVLGDIHAPFHSKKALDIAIKVVKHFRPDVLVQIGDVADFYSVSGYDRDPGKNLGFEHEIQSVHGVLDQLDNLAPRKIFTEGNHENRLNKYIFQKAPELYGYTSVSKALELDKRGWEYHPYQEVVTIGKTSFVHDLGFAGKYSTHQTMDAYPGNIVFGHTHRLGMAVRGNLKRDTYTGINVGWLGDSRAIDYLPSVKVKQDWIHGLLLIEQDKNDAYYDLIRISKGRAFVRGKVIQ